MGGGKKEKERNHKDFDVELSTINKSSKFL